MKCTYDRKKEKLSTTTYANVLMKLYVRLLLPSLLMFFLLPFNTLEAENQLIDGTDANISFETIPPKTYGDSEFILKAEHDQNKELKFKSSNDQIVTISVERSIWTATILSVGDVEITAYYEGENPGDYEEVVQNIRIEKADLFVEAKPQERLYGKENPLVNFEYTYDGFVKKADEGLFTHLPIAYIDRIYGVDTPVGLYIGGVIVSGGEHPYYNLIRKKAILNIIGYVEFPPGIENKTYGDPKFELIENSIAIAKLSVESSAPEIISVSIDEDSDEWIGTIKGVGHVEVTFEAEDINGYVTTKAILFNVQQAPLEIKAEDKSRLVGEDNPELTYTVEGLVYDETVEILSEINISTTATPYSPAGDYRIAVEGGDNPNYHTININGILKVNGYRFIGIWINGEEHKEIDKPYDMECDESNEQYVIIMTQPNSVVTVPGYPLDEHNGFRVITEKPMIKQIEFSVSSEDGLEVETYVLTIEKRFAFDKTAVVRWNNTLSALNNPALLFGYTIDSYQWYKNDIAIDGATNQYYSAGPLASDVLDEGRYHVAFKMATGETLRTCDKVIGQVEEQYMGIFPNPVTIGETVTLETDMDEEVLKDAIIEIYNMAGIYANQVPVTGKSTTFTLPNNAGMYLVKFLAKDGFTQTFKVLVK